MKKRLKKRVIKPATTVHHEDDMVVLHHGDALKVLRAMPDNSVHAVVTDPPYGLSNTDPKHVAETVVQWAQGNREHVPHKRGGFMGKEWDSFVPPVAVWDECFRVLKPGGYLLSFAGSRTIDLMTLSIRLAGFDIRDTIMWLYGSGFPKSMDVSKAVDSTVTSGKSNSTAIRTTNETRPGERRKGVSLPVNGVMADKKAEARYTNDNAATPEGAQWSGWGTALKPAFEPIILARKPFPGTVAKNVLEHGAGAINVDACRIGVGQRVPGGGGFKGGATSRHEGWTRPSHVNGEAIEAHTNGRWPANIALDEEAAEVLDQQSGVMKGVGEGGVSRFFYVAKANKKERPVVDGVAHPTVKPVALMRWLVRMVTPPGGVVLDPFVGSGTTLEAAKIEGVRSVGIEAAEEYLPLAVERINRASTSAAPERPQKRLKKRVGARARMAPPSAR